jgi:hypothetical protein
MTLRLIFFFTLTAVLLVSCQNTMPTAQMLDAEEGRLRQQHQGRYADLSAQQSSGQLTAAEYAEAKLELDKSIRNEADNLAWSRHALAQTERKAQGLPTPDAPVQMAAPGAGGVNGSLYNQSRINGISGQMQGGIMDNMTGTGQSLSGGRAGTLYD